MNGSDGTDGQESIDDYIRRVVGEVGVNKIKIETRSPNNPQNDLPPAKQLPPEEVQKYHEQIRACFEPLCDEWMQLVERRFPGSDTITEDLLNMRQHTVYVNNPHVIHNIEPVLTEALCGKGKIFTQMCEMFVDSVTAPKKANVNDTLMQWLTRESVKNAYQQRLAMFAALRDSHPDHYKDFEQMTIGEVDLLLRWIRYAYSATTKTVGNRGKSSYERSSGVALNRSSQQLWSGIVAQKSPGLAAMQHGLAINVGEYNVEFANRVYKTTRLMLTTTNAMVDSCRKADEKHREGLLKTNFGKDLLGGEVPATLQLMQVAMGSCSQAVQQLTSQKLEGFDDPNVLTKEIIRADLIRDLALRFHIGLLGTTSLVAKHWPNVIQRANDSVEWNPEIISVIDAMQAKYRSGEYQALGNLQAAGYGCPLAIGPAIAEVAKGFEYIFDRVG